MLKNILNESLKINNKIMYEDNGYKKGDVVITTIMHQSFANFFPVGTKVTVIDCDDIMGYDIEDEHGNRIDEIGWEI